MKFFWKIFFTVMFISLICVSASGCILIYSGFRSQIDSEVKIARDYGDIVYYSLAAELREWELYSSSASKSMVSGAQSGDREERGAGSKSGRSEEDEKENRIQNAVVQIAESIGIDRMNQKITFAIIGEDEETLFSSLPQELDKSMISELATSEGQAELSKSSAKPSVRAGWALKKKAQSSYLQLIRPAIYRNCILYIEIVRDVTHIYKNQKEQCEMLIKIMAGMLLLAGALTLLLSKLLLRPIENLSRITKDISSGNLSERALYRGADEIALLSENFNQMADHLEEKICQLEEETEKKELFVGAFSHELKTPLTSIIGYADLLRQKELDKKQQALCAEYIFSEGRRLAHLSMRLLELIVLKKRDFSPEPVEVDQLLEQVLKTAGPQMEAAGITLSCHIQRAVIPMEEELMKTVFINILDNARKAMEAGGAIEIYTESGRPAGREVAEEADAGETFCQGQYCLTIRDQGKGMEQQELAKIREAFYMVDKSRSRKQGGAGLGLAICDEILKLHGFSISFESSPGKGTTVTVCMKGAKGEKE
ncbi:MAG: HAMP domain-containing histidine kinase [Firmicutes bacterium]|nr:HAMP domain-containing histidine kinase [Bacillota bacterium]